MRFIPLVIASASVLAIALNAHTAHAQIATQTVHFSVVPASRASFTAAGGSIAVKTAKPGTAPTSASMSGTSYAITTNERNQKITASIDAPMPAGVSLAVALAAPAGAASAGSMKLGTAATDVVTGISAQSTTALPITYILRTASTSAAASGSRVVTYTITAGL